MFSEIFKRRTREELEDHFIVGTYRTTPKIEEVQTGWPRPWLFTRVLLFVTLVYIGLSVASLFLPTFFLIPGLIMMGSFAMPLATVFLFYELNTPRNVSFVQVLMLVCFGGILSVILSGIVHKLSSFDWLGASSGGIIEEIGKIIAVFLILRKRPYRYILNGLLFGAAVGAGFAAFESAGFAFGELLSNSRVTFDVEAMNSLIQLRALVAPFMHVAWTAIAAGALWRAKGAGNLEIKILFNPRFLAMLLIPMALHMIWNLAQAIWMIEAALGLAGWYVIFSLVQQGLRQVKREQNRAREASSEQAQSLATT